MALAMLVFSPLCDSLGMGKVLCLAWLCHLVGISGTIFAKEVADQGFASGIASTLSGMSGGISNALGFSPMPDPANVGDNKAFWVLWLAAFIIGSANGLVEVAINPLAATLYPHNKTHKLNVLHAWWPGGLIVAGLIALFFVNPLYGKPAEFFNYTIDPAKLSIAEYTQKIPPWKFKYGLIYVPLLLYGLFSVGQRFPATERVQANVSTLAMFLQILRPLFLVWAFCMLLTASTELGTNSWMESILTRTAHVSGTLVFIYITVLMFILRFFAGPIAHKLSPVGMLFVCSILTALGLYGLSMANNWVAAFATATVFALGITYYWPTMLGVTAERFPKGGALLLGLMGCVGNLAISQVTPLMGAIYDSYTVANLPPDLKTAKVPIPNDGQEPLVKEGKVPSWVPPEVARRIYPAGGDRLNPVAREALEPKPGEQPTTMAQEVMQAEAAGASWAFRWTTVLPCVLIVIFGLIALVDKFRGGYRAEMLTAKVHMAHTVPPGKWPEGLRR
jgi:fucose permease